MAKFLNRLLCRFWGHKGPHGTAYKLKRTSPTTAVLTWDCPRCGESERAIMLGDENPGEVIDSTPGFKPGIYLGNNASDTQAPHFAVPMRHDPRRRPAMVFEGSDISQLLTVPGSEREAILNNANIKVVKPLD